MIRELMQLIDLNPTSLNYSRGRCGLPARLQMFFDDTEKDRRVIIEYELGDESVQVTRLSGYNAEKHQWETYHGSRRYGFTGRRGLKALQARLSQMSREYTRWENESFTRYADGRTYVDGTHRQWNAPPVDMIATRRGLEAFVDALDSLAECMN